MTYFVMNRLEGILTIQYWSLFIFCKKLLYVRIDTRCPDYREEGFHWVFFRELFRYKMSYVFP